MTRSGSYRLETPESIELEFELAGPGSRFCAVLLDGCIMGLLALGLLLLAVVLGLGPSLGRALARDLVTPMQQWDSASTWALALLVVGLFLIAFGYHALCEWLMRGQSPGKRAMHLRVLRDDGTALQLSDALLRNLLRVVDFMPLFYGVGGLIAFFHPQHKRLGDLAAGTMVIKEQELDYRATSDRTYRLSGPAAGLGSNPLLSAAERQMLASYFARCGELSPEARARLSVALASRLSQRFGAASWSGDAETYLYHLARGDVFER